MNEWMNESKVLKLMKRVLRKVNYRQNPCIWIRIEIRIKGFEFVGGVKNSRRVKTKTTIGPYNVYESNTLKTTTTFKHKRRQRRQREGWWGRSHWAITPMSPTKINTLNLGFYFSFSFLLFSFFPNYYCIPPFHFSFFFYFYLSFTNFNYLFLSLFFFFLEKLKSKILHDILS